MIKKSHLIKLINFWPPFFGAGIKVEEVKSDFRYMRVSLKLHFWNKNYVGTLFGGSLYAMIDPFYMLMLIENLGKNYIVWDKSASIKYLKPGKTKVWATFNLTAEKIEEIKAKLKIESKINEVFYVEIVDINNEIIAKAEKVISIRSKAQP